MTKSRLNLFVALLRAVNVGGNNMISMSSLKQSFESLGFRHVSTYINSGNIIFNAKETDARRLKQKSERMWGKDSELDFFFRLARVRFFRVKNDVTAVDISA